MKSLILLASLVATSAFAGTYSFSNYDQALSGIALNNACLTNDEVQTINAVKVCTKYETRKIGGGDAPQTIEVCVASAMKDLAFSRAFTRTVCSKYDNSDRGAGCLSYEKVSDFIPNSIKIRTVTESEDHGSNFPGVASNFTFPTCK